MITPRAAALAMIHATKATDASTALKAAIAQAQAMKVREMTMIAAAGASLDRLRTVPAANPATTVLALTHLRPFTPTIRDAYRAQRTRTPEHSKIVAGSVFHPTMTVADVRMIHR